MLWIRLSECDQSEWYKNFKFQDVYNYVLDSSVRLDELPQWRHHVSASLYVF